MDDQVTRDIANNVDNIISKALRDDIFKPLALDTMNHDIVLCPDLGKMFGRNSPALTDFNRIYIDPTSDFFIKCKNSGMTMNQILSILLFHEDFHNILYHNIRLKHRDPDMWNIAGDYVINLLLYHLEREASNRLINLGIKQIPKDLILFSEKAEGLLEEEVYDQLMSNNYKKETTYMSYQDFLDQIGAGGDGEDGDGDGGDTKKDEKSGTPKISKNPDDINGPKVSITEVTFKDLNGNQSTRKIVGLPSAKERGKTEEEESKQQGSTEIARQMFEQSIKEKGVGNSALNKYLGKLFKVKIDWERIARDSILTAVEPGCDMIWHKPRTIWLANPFMPYLPTVDDEETLGVAILAIDESGSMSNDDVKKAVRITVDAEEYYKGLYVIKHDYTSQWHKFYEEKLSDEDIDELCVRRQCGGTSHKDVFAKINEFRKSHPEDLISVFIAITDMYSDIETCQDDIPHDIPRVYIVNSDYQSDKILGRIVRIN